MTKTVNELIEAAEERVLDGMKFPKGKPYVLAEERERNDHVIPLLIDAFDRLREMADDESKGLLPRVFYLARSIAHPNNSPHLLRGALQESQIEAIHFIADEGRWQGRYDIVTVEERLNNGRVFLLDNGFYAAQIRDPKRGCSAGICSNCWEPVAFCNNICAVCDYTFVGPFEGMVSLDEWTALDLEGKQDLCRRIHGTASEGRMEHRRF